MDYKIIVNILINRLKSVLATIIKDDQIGYLYKNSRRCLFVLQIPGILLKTTKPFNWNFLFKT